jgi:photosystem II stability/assembly factor-like uncharacterized protein
VLLAIDPITPATLYALAFGNTVYKSTNGGGNWSRVDANDLAYAGAVTSILVDPLTTSTLYVVAESGVHKSTDSGVHWSPANTGLDMIIDALAIDPLTTSTLYAVGNGYLGGVYKSTNGGGNWTDASSGLYSSTGLPHAYGRSLAIHPTTPSTLYVGLWDNFSQGQTVIGGGIYKSTDSAGNWSPSNEGLKNTNIGSLAVDPTNPGVVYGGAHPGGAYKTSNGGGNWSWTQAGLLGSGISSVVINPLSTNILYVGADSCGVYKSTDGGATFTPVNTGLNFGFVCAMVNDLAINPQVPDILYAGASGGVLKTTNGGSNWFVVNTGLPSSMNVEVLAIDPQSPNTVYAGGYLAGVYKTVDGGEHWTIASTGLGGPTFFKTVYALVVNPLSPSILYAGTPDDGVFKSINGGGFWTPTNSGLPEAPVFNDIYANALVIDPVTPTTLYVGMGSGPNSQTYPVLEGGVFKSSDSGAHWAAVDTGITDFFINKLAISPAAPNTLFAATEGGGIYEIHMATAPPAAFNKTSPGNTSSGVFVHPKLNWVSSIGASYYEYCLKTSSSCDSSGPWTNVGTDTSVTLSELTPYTAYYWQVRARNSLGETYANGSISAGWSFTTGQEYEVYLPLGLR